MSATLKAIQAPHASGKRAARFVVSVDPGTCEAMRSDLLAKGYTGDAYSLYSPVCVDPADLATYQAAVRPYFDNRGQYIGQ